MRNTYRIQLIVLIILLSATHTFVQQPEKNLEDYLTAGIGAQRAGKCEEALQHYAAASKIDPKDFSAQFNSMTLRKGEGALSFFKNALAMRANDAIVHFALGNAYGATGRIIIGVSCG